MLPIRTIAVAAAILCFAGCAVPIGAIIPQQAPVSSPSIAADDQAQQEETSPPEGQPSSAPATDANSDVSSISARGGTSKECTAATAVMLSGAQLALSAASGEVTQAMLDKIFSAPTVPDIPADARADFDRLKATSQALIGIDFTTGTDQLNAFEDAYSVWVDATTKICS